MKKSPPFFGIIFANKEQPSGKILRAALGLICLYVVVALGVGIVVGEPPTERPTGRPPKVNPKVVRDNGYIGSDACRKCHQDQHASWHASYHRSMTQVASPNSVQAPFDGTELELEGTTWKLEKRGEEFWVQRRFQDQSNSQAAGNSDRRVAMVTGSHNYQVLWLEEEEEGAGMGQFPLVYFLAERLWAPRKARFLGPTPKKTSNETGRWRRHCIKCHSTNGQQEHLPSHETRVAELGISCEACHGPGAEHAEYQRDLQPDLSAIQDIINPRKLTHQRSTEVCGQCHGIEIFLEREKALRWKRDGPSFRPGNVLAEHQVIVNGSYKNNPPEVQQYLDRHPYFSLENCFWPDGMVRVSGREYHGIVESPCFQRGEMSCISCHSLHQPKNDERPLKEWANDQLRPESEGNQACIQCHTDFSAPDRLTAHTHHRIGSSGSSCYNCHMPHTTWGLLRAIRSHTIESPSVATSVQTGRPNACNQCHLDRTLAWSSEKLKDWYDIAPPALTEDHKTLAASVLWSVKGDPVQRALMAWSMGWEPAREISGSQWLVYYLANLLSDPYDAVRFRAQRSLLEYPEYAASATDSVRVSTESEHQQLKSKILEDWLTRFPLAPDRTGVELLINADGSINHEAFQKLSAERDDDNGLTLFE